MLRLREEEPALGEQPGHLDEQRDEQSARRAARPTRPAQDEHRHRERAGDRAALIVPSAAREAPWKNSRVLNEPADMPIEVCTSRSARMPVAVCSVELWRMRALRRSASSRVMHATR